jgi:uncharacterized protein YjiS (DUF1127 family)
MNRIYAAYRNWRLYRRTYRELMQLSPRELRDLGISRGQIPDIAKQVFVD